MKNPKGPCSGLSRRGEKILIALLEHPTQEKAAVAAEVSTSTLWRWRRKPEFQKALLEARRDLYAQSMARLQQGLPAAATTVLRTMVEPSASHTAKLRAAQMVFDNVARGVEFQDLDIRVRELERLGQPTATEKVVPKPPMFSEQHELHEDKTNDQTDCTAD